MTVSDRLWRDSGDVCSTHDNLSWLHVCKQDERVGDSGRERGFAEMHDEALSPAPLLSPAGMARSVGVSVLHSPRIGESIFHPWLMATEHKASTVGREESETPSTMRSLFTLPYTFDEAWNLVAPSA